jgi:16S rRNA processing protein RimM
VVLLTIGRIVRPHGIRGEVLVDVRTDEPGARFAAGSVLATDPAGAGPLTIEYARGHAQGGRQRLIVAFAEIADRDAAEDARGIALMVDGGDVTDPDDPDEFHDLHLVGLTAVGPDGEKIGEVVRVDHMPSAELLAVRRSDGKEALIPFVKAIVPEVDLQGGRVVVTPPEGLFDL